jgi:hypothetical protein
MPMLGTGFPVLLLDIRMHALSEPTSHLLARALAWMLMLDTTLPQQGPQAKLRVLQELTNH